MPNIFENLAASNDFEEFDLSTPNSTQTNFSENDSIQDEGNIFQRLAQKEDQRKKDSFGFLSTIKDVGEQVLTKGIAGIGGAYGNILDVLGLQNPQGQMTPGEETRQKIESDILDKINRGEKVSTGDLSLLSSDDQLPTSLRYPTSEEIKTDIEVDTDIGKGKTAAGRIAGRGSEFVGESLPLGGGSPKVLGALAGSGVAGQSAREIGLPEGVATGIEVGGSILPSFISKALIPSGRAAKDTLQAAKNIGLTPKQTAPLLQSDKKIATLSKIARKGEGTKKQFASIKESLGDSYNNLKKLPESQKKLASGTTANLKDDFYQVAKELEKTLEPSPEKKQAIDFIKNAIGKLNKKKNNG